MVTTFRQLPCERGYRVSPSGPGYPRKRRADPCWSPFPTAAVGGAASRAAGGRRAWAGDSAGPQLIAWKRWGNPWHRVLRGERAERPVFQLPAKPEVSKIKSSSIIQTHSKHMISPTTRSTFPISYIKICF